MALAEDLCQLGSCPKGLGDQNLWLQWETGSWSLLPQGIAGSKGCLERSGLPWPWAIRLGSGVQNEPPFFPRLMCS